MGRWKVLVNLLEHAPDELGNQICIYQSVTLTTRIVNELILELGDLPFLITYMGATYLVILNNSIVKETYSELPTAGQIVNKISDLQYKLIEAYTYLHFNPELITYTINKWK